MFGARLRRLWVVLVGAAIGTLFGAGTALAYGPCGQDFDDSTACPITTSALVMGSLGTDSEYDYYVFYAKKGTQLTLTVADTETPTCGTPANEISCGFAMVNLYDGRGHLVGQSDTSFPDNGVTDPVVMSRKLSAGGTYYAAVTGQVNAVVPLPYSLDVNGTPNVMWPPPCTVPKLRKNTTLGRAESLLGFHHCSVGRIRHVGSRQVRRGRVAGLRPRAGTVAPAGTRVGILVSAG